MKIKWILIGGAVFVTIYVLFFSTRPAPLPDELVGFWKTSNPGYEDRFLELSKATIIFGTGNDGLDTNFISNVEKVLRNGAVLYTVHFHRPNEPENKISFYYDPKNGGTIMFKNQNHIRWNKVVNEI
jgi:hypothetical protein